MKRFKWLLLMSPMIITSMVSCGGGKNQDEEEVIKFTQIMDAQSPINVPGKVDENTDGEATLDVNQILNNNNYLKLLVKSKNSFKGRFVYSNLEDSSQVVEEDFFVEGNANEEEIDFRQFLDAYRTDINPASEKIMSIGAFAKKLEKIVFVNFNEEPITITVDGLFMSDRVIPEENKELYIEQDNLKVGMDLSTGGTLTYLEKTELNGVTINEVINEDNIEIGPDFMGDELLSEHVNLINIYDPGRQIQQSYYSGVGGVEGGTEPERQQEQGPANGYTRRWCNTAGGYYWPYNPVQGGDEPGCISQIVDFRRSKNELYCKTRSLDWAGGDAYDIGKENLGNRVTKSYTENWYTIKDGMLYAKNRFIDWNGFTNLEEVGGHNLEIPATYISHPLHTLCSYKGNNPWEGESDFDIQPALGSWKAGSYKTNKHAEDWFAWVNGEDMSNAFGVGIYIPGATYYASGRSYEHTDIYNELNYGAWDAKILDTQYNKPDPTSDYTGCYVRNTSYTAPVVTVKMKEYVPLQYQYVIAVDYVKSFRKRFKKIHKLGEVDAFNAAGLTAWNY